MSDGQGNYGGMGLVSFGCWVVGLLGMEFVRILGGGLLKIAD